MNCTDVEKEIELYVLGGADATKSLQIERHLRGCPNCRRLQRECEDILLDLKAHGQASCDHRALIEEIRSASQPLIRRATTRKRSFQFASVAAGFILVATIWFGSTGDKQSPAPDRDTAPNKTVWRKAATVAAGAAEADDIVIHDGTIFLLLENDAGQAVSAVEADSGRTLWQSELVGCGYLAADDEHVYCLALADQARVHLLALDRNNGRRVWAYETQQATSVLYGISKPTVMPGHRICWVHEDSAYAIDARTGEKVWSRVFPEERHLSQAAVIGREVYVAGRNGIYCIDGENGADRWHLSNRSEAWLPTKPLTAVGRDRLFVVTADRNGKSSVRCVDTSAQRSLWQKSVPKVSHLCADAAHVYLRCQQVLALDQENGEHLWTIEATGCSPITTCDDTICFIDSTREGSLVGARCYNGDVVWKVPGLHSCNAFIRAGERGYLKTNDNVVLAFAFD
ncbi:MAG: PQQ-binding-like beta-propeller repeat protein [Sedimentisphaerales bacterium]|nr:PQQ-binding-like beta-propeller repeat protein [Sedimentisphaerales bacterium]